jgi:release factor glutamine methyltransferase
VRLVVPPGVFRPRSDTWLLAGLLREQRLPHSAAVLDLCTGTGALAVTAALAGARRVEAVDVSRRAVMATRLNAALNGVRVRARRGDLFAAVDGRRFDAIVSNPPYLPATEESGPPRGRARWWDGGPDGRAVLDRIIAGAADHLHPGGILLLVHSSVCGEQQTLDGLAAVGLAAEVVARRPGPLGALLDARSKVLEERGLLPPGRRQEELLVFRAQLPG